MFAAYYATFITQTKTRSVPICRRVGTLARLCDICRVLRDFYHTNQNCAQSSPGGTPITG